jgi:hypothetical protein
VVDTVEIEQVFVPPHTLVSSANHHSTNTPYSTTCMTQVLNGSNNQLAYYYYLSSLLGGEVHICSDAWLT